MQSWEQLCALVGAVRKQAGWLFRGVKSYSYDLVPGIGRPGLRADPKAGATVGEAEERRLFREFQRRARHLVGTAAEEIEALAVAQHHGLPTRLLDWTDSFFVAAFFAVEACDEDLPAGLDADACIYAVRNLRLLDGSVWNIPKGDVRVYRPPHIAGRIVAQRGLFTVSGGPDQALDLEELVKDGSVQARRIRIKHDACREIREALDTAGINASVLMPDLDGLAEHLAWQFRWNRIPRRS